MLGLDLVGVVGREHLAQYKRNVFKATLQAVLLFGSDTLDLITTSLKCLERFQV